MTSNVAVTAGKLPPCRHVRLLLFDFCLRLLLRNQPLQRFLDLGVIVLGQRIDRPAAPWVAAIVGFVAGVLSCLKPHFLIIALAPEPFWLLP